MKRTLIVAAAIGAVLVMGAALPRAQAPSSPAVHAADDGLAMTPPMGWYPWNIFGQEPQNERLIKEIVDALVSSGMKDAGYTYVGPDEGICFVARRGRPSQDEPRALSLRPARPRRFHPSPGPQVCPLHRRRDPHVQQGHARHQGPRGRGHAPLRRLARGLHQDRLVQHRGPGNRRDLYEAPRRPARRGPARRPQPLLLGRGRALESGRPRSDISGGRPRTFAARERRTGNTPSRSPSRTRSSFARPGPATGTTPTCSSPACPA